MDENTSLKPTATAKNPVSLFLWLDAQAVRNRVFYENTSLPPTATAKNRVSLVLMRSLVSKLK
ncbi:hypothetical protein QUA54_12230 [Microcoleus sp. MOSTC5]|uniref:hypothetical protein n=1 Tax=Microcoleus sp. MOSTC5 TaxID=3055378 RepID=UPI002FD49A53